MQLHELTYTEGIPVDGYGPGFFRVGGQVHHGGLLILPNHIGSWYGYDDRQALLSGSSTIDVLFVGTGAEIAPVPADFRQAMEAAGPGVEYMNSPAACRTYNILLSEGRRIGLVLFPV